jgi:hypothetical protein
VRTPAAAAAAQQKAAASGASKFPPSFTAWVERCFARCRIDSERQVGGKGGGGGQSVFAGKDKVCVCARKKKYGKIDVCERRGLSVKGRPRATNHPRQGQ